MIYSAAVHAPKDTKTQEYLAGWQRARAELLNYRRRQTERDAAAELNAKREVAEPLILLARNFRALTTHVPPELAANSWTQGVLHIARQCEQLLAELGITTLGQVDETFNPRYHEAIEHVPAEGKKSDIVVEVVQPGFAVGDVVISPAHVKVSK